MKTFRRFRSLAAVACLAGCSYVHHVPPGQSAAFAFAKKPELVALPPAPEPVPVKSTSPEPALPEIDRIADNFAMGNFCLEGGRFPEAIKAYQTVVKLSPNFAEAWTKLAL